jgi:hypothetical protein
MSSKRQRKTKAKDDDDDDFSGDVNAKNLFKKTNIIVQSVPTVRNETHLISFVPSYQHGKPQIFGDREIPKTLTPKQQQPVNTDEGSRDAKLVYKAPTASDGIKLHTNNIKASLQHLR